MSKILMCSSEVAPFAKTGGLADVVGALPQYLDKDDAEYMCWVAEPSPGAFILFKNSMATFMNNAEHGIDSLFLSVMIRHPHISGTEAHSKGMFTFPYGSGFLIISYIFQQKCTQLLLCQILCQTFCPCTLTGQ